MITFFETLAKSTSSKVACYSLNRKNKNSLSARIVNGASALVAIGGVGALARPAEARAARLASAIAIVASESGRAEARIPALVTSFL